jgi:rod shape-determining protein MreC
MNWIERHRVFTTIAAVLLVLLILLFLSYSLRNQESAVGVAARTVISAVQKPFAALGVMIGDQTSELTVDGNVLYENEALHARIQELEEELTIQRLDREELLELRELRRSLSGTGQESAYTLVSGNVISFEGSNKFNIFTIDIGSESGIRRNAVVVSGNGLVGRVLSTGNGWSQVVAAIDENNNIGFQVHGEKDFIGVCRGDGMGMLTGELLDEDGVADAGDEAVTSGNGGIYPAGIVIGTITKTELTGDDPLLSVTIEPAVYFKGLKKVAVLV